MSGFPKEVEEVLARIPAKKEQPKPAKAPEPKMPPKDIPWYDHARWEAERQSRCGMHPAILLLPELKLR